MLLLESSIQLTCDLCVDTLNKSEMVYKNATVNIPNNILQSHCWQLLTVKFPRKLLGICRHFPIRMHHLLILSFTLRTSEVMKNDTENNSFVNSVLNLIIKH